MHSTGKFAYVTATFPYVILIALLIRGVTLPGAKDGVNFFIVPQWDRLVDIKVWVDAGTQIFFSLSVAFGGLIAFGSHNPEKNDCVRDAFLVSLINCATSILAGFVTFSIIGHMAHTTGRPVADVVSQGPGLVFIVFPTAVVTMPGANVWAVLFFFMLILLGAASQFGWMQGVVTAIRDTRSLSKFPNWVVAGVVCSAAYLIGLLCICRGGIYFFQLFDYYSTSLPLITVGLFEIIAVSWVYGVDKFLDDIFEMTGRRLGLIWWILFKFVVPVLLAGLWLASVIAAVSQPLLFDYPGENEPRPYPAWAIGLGWVIMLLSLTWIPVYLWLHRPPGWAGAIVTWFRTRTLAWLASQFKRPARSRLGESAPDGGGEAHINE